MTKQIEAIKAAIDLIRDLQNTGRAPTSGNTALTLIQLEESLRPAHKVPASNSRELDVLNLLTALTLMDQSEWPEFIGNIVEESHRLRAENAKLNHDNNTMLDELMGELMERDSTKGCRA